MQALPWFARSGRAAIGCEPLVTTSSKAAALIARYVLTPGVGVGPLRFGDHIHDHPDLLPRRLEPDYPFDVETDYAEYTVSGLDELLIVYVDEDDRIDSVGFYEFCLVDGRDLIGMGVGELLVRLGAPTTIEAEQVGRAVELLYMYDELGVTLWTIDGEVCVVHAGLADDLDDDLAG